MFYLRNRNSNYIFHMQVDFQLVNKLANLSKLEFNEEENKMLQHDLEKILNFMEKLNELNTEGIEPLIYINEDVASLRKDEVHYPISKEEALVNAPLKDENYIKVPKFVTGTKY